jgi:hypothetical protein
MHTLGGAQRVGIGALRASASEVLSLQTIPRMVDATVPAGWGPAAACTDT